MKKQAFSILLAVTGIFLAFTVGLFVGRNHTHADIQISDMPLHADKLPEPPAEETEQPEESVSFPVDINSATQAELAALPGIGEALAGRILDYRSSHGSFSAPEELLNVSGIGAGKLEAILDLITTGGRIS